MGRKQLKRELNREALSRLEDAARSPEDFRGVVDWWDRLDENRERVERYWEKQRPDEWLEWKTPVETIIPPPIPYECWRQLLRGDFLDLIFDCPYEIHELTSSRFVSELVREFRENQKEILYLRAIKQYTPQKIAAIREQSDRNVRKVYDTLIEGLQNKLYERLAPRYENYMPLTFAQKEFVERCIAKYNKKSRRLDASGDA